MTFNIIPEISMLDIKNRDEKTIHELSLALTSHGFFTITDHGISDEILTESYKLSKDFFDLDENIKLSLIHI